MKINWNVLGSRLGYGLLAGLLTSTSTGHIPTSTGALLSLAAGSVVAAAPSALSAAGIIRPVSPDQQSLFGFLGQSVSTLITDNKAQRQADLHDLLQQAGQAGAQAVLNQVATKTGVFSAEQLGGGLSVTFNSAPPQGAAQGVQPLDAVTATGGNQ